MQEASKIENAGTFNANGESSSGISNDGGVQSLVHNASGGTFVKSAGSGTTTVGVPFDNDGAVEISKGILSATTYTQSATGTLHLHVGGLKLGQALPS